MPHNDVLKSADQCLEVRDALKAEHYRDIVTPRPSSNRSTNQKRRWIAESGRGAVRAIRFKDSNVLFVFFEPSRLRVAMISARRFAIVALTASSITPFGAFTLSRPASTDRRKPTARNR